MDDELKNRAVLGKKILGVASKISKMKTDMSVHYGNTHYDYISSNKLTTYLNDIMNGSDLWIFPEVIHTVCNSNTVRDKNGNDKEHFKSTVNMQFEILDCETGYSISKTFSGSSTDTNGKELAQAITDCTKRFYLKTFFIAESDQDPDGIIPDKKPTEKKSTEKKTTKKDDMKNELAKIPDSYISILKEMKIGKSTTYKEMQKYKTVEEFCNFLDKAYSEFLENKGKKDGNKTN